MSNLAPLPPSDPLTLAAWLLKEHPFGYCKFLSERS
jgi:hypothetical protein